MNYWAIEQALRLCKTNEKYMSDFKCMIAIHCQELNVYYPNDEQLHSFCVQWLNDMINS